MSGDDESAERHQIEETIDQSTQSPFGGNRALPSGATQDFTFGSERSKKGRSSLGLHILCPHCSNPVELLVNTAKEDVSCISCGSVFNLIDRPEQTMTAEPLQRVGRFELVARLGIGGFGSVWKARDTDLDRVVALKIPRKSELSDFELDQFFREARAVAQLRHPNIVPVHEIGKHEGTIFIVCDLIRGGSLADQLKAGRMPQREVAEKLGKVALGLQHAHECGVVHRDVKPSNVMIDVSGEPVLMDFGLAKRETNEVTMTMDGQVMGTPSYMSPEQAHGRSHEADQRTDIYSLGVMLFQMLTGELPFRGNVQMQIRQRTTDDPPDPRSLNRNIHQDLSTICLKCLEREPDRRYSTAKSVAAEFNRFLEGKPILARPISKVERIARWIRRNPMPSALAALTTFLAIAGPVAAWRINSDRDKLNRLVTEKVGIIEEMEGNSEDNASRVEELSEKLKTYEGKSNPWSYWTVDNPRRQLLTRLHRNKSEEVAELLKKADLEEGALGEFALGILSEADTDYEQAESRFRKAAEELVKCAAKNTGDSKWLVLLADCYARHAQAARSYAELTDDEVTRAEMMNSSSESLRKAADRYEKLGEQRHRVELLDIALRRSIVDGVDANQYLNEIGTIESDITNPGIDDLTSFFDSVRAIENGWASLPAADQ